jgi:hypothetical protein
MSQERPDLGFRPTSYAQLRTMTKDQMINIFDSLSPYSRPGGVEFNDPSFWLAEIHRLDQDHVNRSILKLTKWVTAMTVIITVATIGMLCATLRGR